MITPRTLTYVTTEDLGFSQEAAALIADVADVTTGDANLTIINSNRFQQAVEDALGLTRGAVIRNKLLALQVHYVAFIG